MTTMTQLPDHITGDIARARELAASLAEMESERLTIIRAGLPPGKSILMVYPREARYRAAGKELNTVVDRLCRDLIAIASADGPTMSSWRDGRRWDGTTFVSRLNEHLDSAADMVYVGGLQNCNNGWSQYVPADLIRAMGDLGRQWAEIASRINGSPDTALWGAFVCHEAS